MAGITFEISPAACGGGGHYEVTISAAGQSFTEVYHETEASSPPTNDQLKSCADVLFRLLIDQIGHGSHAAVLDRIHNLEITVQPRASA